MIFDQLAVQRTSKTPAKGLGSALLVHNHRHADRTASNTPDGAAGWTTLSDPIQPRQLTDLAFCDRSFWLQPWRAYLNTPLASTLANAISVNLNVAPPEIARTAKLLAAHGIHRVRVELPWALMSY